MTDLPEIVLDAMVEFFKMLADYFRPVIEKTLKAVVRTARNVFYSELISSLKTITIDLHIGLPDHVEA